ncbi:uncharacterized protein FOMMEDRAFT_105285 [Fomitiporia mediterranea MF3/22]|uniref:uncharacterized protein n=1 Tax=Fomitiporia mediterranea (strain MF3/22) TaxID=694068 RepID=UPI0004407677|nr:uncharacterized protein FOMMEDRAFT_105285 [Fomitiporia mediterranea MF3/22]EJD05047.1 hypothetical protein FOMMEDRAFT_105285 [Fomitiporia mediterranea MF3/22]
MEAKKNTKGNDSRNGQFGERQRGLERKWLTMGMADAERVRRPMSGPPTSAAAANLHERVDALINRSRAEISARAAKEETQAEELSLHYDDGVLLQMYADLLTHPKGKPKDRSKTVASAERKKLLQSVANRLVVASGTSCNTSMNEEVEVASSPTLASRLAARRGLSLQLKDDGSSEQDFLDVPQSQLDPQKLHHGILLRFIDVVREMERAQKVVGKSTTMSVAVLSSREWNALVHTAIELNEIDLAERALLLMKRCEMEPTEDLVNDVMSVHASNGDVPAVASLFEKLAIGKPTARQRDLHIKAHMKTSSSDYGNIQSALHTLHNYEALALLPPVESYTRLISALFSTCSAQLRAHAWDLFSHMRYVAHAKPDPALYALMIRACAGTGFSHSGYVADPARALDLWTEMTTEAGYKPDVGAYNAVILACARVKEYAADAFRLAREMLDGHRDAYGDPLMHATQETFNALLVAAKTRKDLARARWILAEMIKIYNQCMREGRDNDVAPDTESVMHVFHAYASFIPSQRRSELNVIDESEVKAVAEVSANGQAEQDPPHEEDDKAPVPARAPFSISPPQTRQEVLAEADALFERILEEKGAEASASRSEEKKKSKPGPFSSVLLQPKLLNSYLCVYYMHGSLEDSRRLYEEVYRRTGVERSPRTYVEALDRCARAKKDERDLARSFAESIWIEWLEVEKGLNPNSTDARQIERAHAAMIRVYALVNDLDRAMQLVRSFETIYTPRAVASPALSPSYHEKNNRRLKSASSLLVAKRPLVRLTTTTEVQDDTVPPLLTPRDLELLHHRLVVAAAGASGRDRKADIDFLTYLGNAYMGSLRKRRDRTIQAKN